MSQPLPAGIDLARLQAIARRLREQYGAERVLLYGSVARGEATPDSDVDILVVADTREKFFDRMAQVLQLVRDLYDLIPLAPIVLTPAEVQERLERGDQFIEEILRTGREL